MTDHTDTNTAFDLPPYYADLASDGPYPRAVAATVAAGLLSQVRPFKGGGTALFGSSGNAAPMPEPTDISTAVIDLAEWVMTGIHPLAAWRDDDEEADDEDTEPGDVDVIADDVDMKDPEWRP